MTTAAVTPPLNPPAPAGTWRLWHTLSLTAIIAALGLLGLARNSLKAEGLWLATALLLVVFCLIAGKATTGQWAGLLIDQRNKMSLSRLQLVLWTLLILSAFIAAVMSNLAQVREPWQPPADDPGRKAPRIEDSASIAVPPEIWALLGISTVSLVGSPLIKNKKREDKPSSDARAKAESLTTTNPETRVEGVLVENTTPDRAGWADLFQGEEVGNAKYLDLGKIQMFFFTLLLVVAYAYLLRDVFAADRFIDELPSVSEGMTALLGISHAGYLANKTIPHTPETPG